ncbi:hypothetical protein B0H14DRAFT_2916995 [Mycena olivaceomarginata]|nr:hypothetical protein B0H14DRAFT_2916995 [Mycena olivaceomarginata]
MIWKIRCHPSLPRCIGLVSVTLILSRLGPPICEISKLEMSLRKQSLPTQTTVPSKSVPVIQIWMLPLSFGETLRSPKYLRKGGWIRT